MERIYIVTVNFRVFGIFKINFIAVRSAVEQYFPVLLFIMLFKVVLTVLSESTASKQYFPVVSFVFQCFVH